MSNRCINTEELREFMLGRLSEQRSEDIDFHLQQCADCEDTVAGLDMTQDSLIDDLRGIVAEVEEHCDATGRGSDGIENDSEFQLAMANAKEVGVEFGTDADALESKERLSRECFKTVGQYEIVDLLGCGGMGSVYRARHPQLEKEVAIKVLPNRKVHNSAAIARFTREMKLIGKMDHPAMVSATDAGRDDGVHFLVMELVDGLDLAKVLRRMGPLNVHDACELVRQAALGLQYAHDQGVIHRDIKPSNLMLNRDGKVKVLDLGLATLGGLNATEDQLTTIGQLMGTLDYMAPEQCGNHRRADARSDVYGLGATLYRLLTGKSPYSSPENNTPLKKIRAMATSEGLPILERDSSLPPELADIVSRCLAREPEARFQSAGKVAELLAEFSTGNRLEELIEGSLSQTSAGDFQTATPTQVEREFDQAADQLRDYFHENQATNSPNRKTLPATSSGFSKFIQMASILCLLAGFAWAGIVLYLQTSMGMLKIESEIDDVHVTLIQNGKEVEDLKIETGEKTTRLWAGQYQVEIRAKSNGLLISEDTYEVKRGETTVAKITRVEHAGQFEQFEPIERFEEHEFDLSKADAEQQFWDSGEVTKFAMAGIFDIDDDDVADGQHLRTMIMNEGGLVIAYHDMSGKLIGRVDQSVRYLILGSAPIGNSQMRKGYDAVVNRAKKLGIPTVKEKKFLNWLKGNKNGDNENKKLNLGSDDAGRQVQATFFRARQKANSLVESRPKEAMRELVGLRSWLIKPLKQAKTIDKRTLAMLKIVQGDIESLEGVHETGDVSTPVAEMQVAVAGLIDFDRDGKSDDSALAALLADCGGEIAARYDSKGKMTGKFDSSSRFLVVGSCDEGAIDGIKLATMEAKLLAVELVSLQAMTRKLGFEFELGVEASSLPSDRQISQWSSRLNSKSANGNADEDGFESTRGRVKVVDSVENTATIELGADDDFQVGDMLSVIDSATGNVNGKLVVESIDGLTGQTRIIQVGNAPLSAGSIVKSSTKSSTLILDLSRVKPISGRSVHARMEGGTKRILLTGSVNEKAVAKAGDSETKIRASWDKAIRTQKAVEQIVKSVREQRIVSKVRLQKIQDNSKRLSERRLKCKADLERLKPLILEASDRGSIEKNGKEISSNELESLAEKLIDEVKVINSRLEDLNLVESLKLKNAAKIRAVEVDLVAVSFELRILIERAGGVISTLIDDELGDQDDDISRRLSEHADKMDAKLNELVGGMPCWIAPSQIKRKASERWIEVTLNDQDLRRLKDIDLNIDILKEELGCFDEVFVNLEINGVGDTPNVSPYRREKR